MSINLSKLPAPDVLEDLSYEALLQENVNALQRLIPDWQALESDMYMPVIEAFTYREIILRHRINSAAKAVMLAYAMGADLDHLAAFYNVLRKEVSPADATANPPIDAVFESDEVLRQRITLALYQYSTAGSIDSYKFHAFDSSALVKDVSVRSPLPGEVDVVILSHETNGMASATLRHDVLARLNQDKVRPLTDLVHVVSASIVPFTLDATIFYYGNQSFAVVKALAESQLNDYLHTMHKLGNNIHASAIHGALQVEGVQRVDLHGFTDMIIDDTQAAWNTSYTLNDGGFDA